jgi:hypothetical protein
MTHAVGVPPRQSSDDIGSIASIAAPKSVDGSGVISTSGSV